MSTDLQSRPESDTELGQRLPTTVRNAPASGPPPRASRPAWRRFAWVGVLLAVIAAAGSALVATMGGDKRTRVLSHTVTRGDLVVSVTEQGTLESSSNKEIKCKVKGGSTVLWVIESGTMVQPGDVLVRLDTSTIEDNISQQRIAYENALAIKKTAENDVAVATIGITEYLEGTFRSDRALKLKDLAIAQSSLKSAINSRDHARRMFRKGYISQLELDAQQDAVRHAELDVQVKQTDLEVLEKFTRAKTVQERKSLLEIAKAQLASTTASLELEEARLRRAEEQLKNCVIKADVAGMVIYPSAAEWKEQPDIEEGAAVREDQVLLMIPDLNQMQAKIGIHEAKIDRVKPGMKARVIAPDGLIEGEVDSVASITKPTGWWNGNVVKYDTVIKIDRQAGLKPGMSVAVEVILAEHHDVLTVPVVAVVERGGEFFCWVEQENEYQKRPVRLGDSNERFIIVQSGLQEADRVALNPIDFLDEAQSEALTPIEMSQQAPPAGEK